MEIHEANPKSLLSKSLRLAPSTGGKLHRSALPCRGLPALVYQHARANPNKIFAETATQQLTYGELAELVTGLAGQLMECPSWTPGDRVALVFNNSLEYVVSLLGTMDAALVAVPVPPDMEISRARRILSLAAPARILTSAQWLNKYRSAISNYPAVDEDSKQPPLSSAPSDLAAILFTSGSTGEPKGVMLTHENLTSNAASIVEYLELNASERAVVVVPFYHALGNSILTSHLAANASLVLGQSIMFPEDLLDCVERCGVTSISGVPEVFNRLLQYSSLAQRKCESLRYMAVAGGMLNVPAIERLRDQISPAKFFVMYGQTEATARLAYVPPNRLRAKMGSIGRAIPGVSLEIVGEDGSHRGKGEVGELRASGPNISPGYWNDAQSTAAAFRDGWLYTGDMGRMDDEGFIFLEGRQKSFLKRYGFRMHTREIDEFLIHRLQLRQSVTIMFPREGEPGLAVFAQPSFGQSLSREDLRRLCFTCLPRFKLPDYFEIVEEYPLNDSMKIDHHALRERVLKCA